MATSIGQYASVFLPEELPFLTEKPGRPPSTGSQRVGHYRSEPAHIGSRLFFCLWQLCPSERRVWRLVQLLGLQGPWQRQVCRVNILYFIFLGLFWFCLWVYMYMCTFSHSFYCYKPLHLRWAFAVFWSFPFFSYFISSSHFSLFSLSLFF